MQADFIMYSLSDVPFNLYQRGQTAVIDSTLVATAIGTSKVRKRINFGSRADGEYDMESVYPPSAWAVKIAAGVATIYGDWVAAESQSLDGQYNVTFRIRSGAAIVSGALVTIKRSGSVVTSGLSGVSDGNMVYPLTPGTYTVTVTASGFTAVVDQAFTVVASAINVDVSLTQQSIDPPATPGLCTVRFQIRKANGTTPVSGATVHAQLEANNSIDGMLLSNVKHTGTTNASGIVDLVLVKKVSIIKGDGVYHITAVDPDEPDTDDPLLDIRVTIPNQDTITADELIEEVA